MSSYGAYISGPEDHLLQGIASGQQISQPLEITLLDMDNQIIDTDNSSYVTKAKRLGLCQFALLTMQPPSKEVQ